MDHLKIYRKIIEKAQTENRKRFKKNDKKYVYYEQHHILPICLNGNNDKENLVLLTAREHYICHKLLFYIYSGHKLACALHRMTYSKRYDKYLSSRDYALAKELKASAIISNETRKKMSDAKKGDKNPNKNGLNEEHKRKIRESNRRGWKHTLETRKKLKETQAGPRPYRRKTYILTSPDNIEYKIETRKKVYIFIAEHKLSQRKIMANINKGIISEENFKYLKETSKKTLGWQIQKI